MFSEKLRTLRKQNKITQVELAQMLNLDKSSIAKYESANVTPSPEVLISIAKIFKVSIDYLLDNADTPNPATDINIDMDDIQYALNGEVRELSDEDKKKILEFARFVKEQSKKK